MKTPTLQEWRKENPNKNINEYFRQYPTFNNIVNPIKYDVPIGLIDVYYLISYKNINSPNSNSLIQEEKIEKIKQLKCPIIDGKIIDGSCYWLVSRSPNRESFYEEIEAKISQFAYVPISIEAKKEITKFKFTFENGTEILLAFCGLIGIILILWTVFAKNHTVPSYIAIPVGLATLSLLLLWNIIRHFKKVDSIGLMADVVQPDLIFAHIGKVKTLHSFPIFCNQKEIDELHTSGKIYLPENNNK